MSEPDSPSPTEEAHGQALRAVRRGVRMARVSSVVMIGLGGLSALFSLRQPLSPAFVVSVAVVVIGFIERRTGKALQALDETAPRRLAINQVVLGLVIAGYALAQIWRLDPAAIDEVLRSPTLAPLLDVYPPDLVDQVRNNLPQLLRLFYYLVGAVALVGCLGTAWFYHARLRHVRIARSAQPDED